jgi:hypothetical protein
MYKQIAVGCLLISIMGCSTESGYSTKGDVAVIEESLVSGLQVKYILIPLICRVVIMNLLLVILIK